MISKRTVHLLAILILAHLIGGAPTASAQQQEPIWFSGLLHTPLGDASLKITDDGLNVSNVGSSSEYGVEIDIGAYDFVCVELDLADPNIRRGAKFQMTSIGRLEGKPETELGSLQMLRTNSGYELSADFPTSTSNRQTVKIYRKGKVVATVRSAIAPVIAMSTPTGPMMGDPGHEPIWPRPMELLLEPADPTEPLTYSWDEDGILKTVLGDRIVFESSASIEPAVLSQVQIQASDMPSFHILSELPGMFDRQRQALSIAQFDPATGQLR